MSVSLTVRVVLRSGREAIFEGIRPGRPFRGAVNGITVKVGRGSPASVTVTPPSAADLVRGIEYNLYTDMRNYQRVVIPDSGRWHIFSAQTVSFWRFNIESSVNDVKTPLYIFTAPDLNVGLAFGIIGRNYETGFRILEPRHNRALIVYMRRLSMQIRRGTDLYPIPDSVAAANADGAITEHLYFRTAQDMPAASWVSVLRDFAAHQKRLYRIPDVGNLASMAPLWCSWTDWHSNDVTDKVVLQQVREGTKLGIGNYIIDDGWFGPGLDNEFDVPLNIGDWRPDPAKFPDMARLVADIKALGARPMVWCAPHAVAAGADCFQQRRPLLIVGDDGKPITTSNSFHSLCFQCPEAREAMAAIAENFITEWGFDGAKYDLFNCVPNARCRAVEHRHDTDSMVEGLERTLEAMARRCRALRPDYIIELKQNYGTPWLARHGTMTRAGDTPYCPEGNYLRTLHVQAYSPFAINDYQTVTNADSPQDAACVVIKMLAAGIPTYSIDFDRLGEANKRVIAHYNGWYNANLTQFMRHRTPLDGEANVLRLQADAEDYVFLVNNSGAVPLERATTILNGTHKGDLFVRTARPRRATVAALDCQGVRLRRRQAELRGWTHLDAPPGGMLRIEFAPPARKPKR
jgi:hypothetical protein